MRHGGTHVRHFRDEAVALDPTAGELDEGRRFPLCRPEALASLFQSAGLRGISTEPLEMTTEFADFDDYWRPFLGRTGPAPAYAMSLDPARRGSLRTRLRQRLGAEGDGRIRLRARAWAVRGHAR